MRNLTKEIDAVDYLYSDKIKANTQIIKNQMKLIDEISFLNKRIFILKDTIEAYKRIDIQHNELIKAIKKNHAFEIEQLNLKLKSK